MSNINTIIAEGHKELDERYPEFNEATRFQVKSFLSSFAHKIAESAKEAATGITTRNCIGCAESLRRWEGFLQGKKD